LIKGDWWTKMEGTTDVRGKVNVRAFYGTHRITAQLPDGQSVSREIQWKRRQKNQFELTT
jgi:hypothetical protein